MATETFTITGDVNVQITITELPGGELQFDVNVLDDTGSIGDLNALYFDLYDDSLTTGLNVTGGDVTGTAFKIDGVTKVDSYTNMNGEVVKELGKFDGGIQFGTSGMAEDDIQSTTFILSHDTADLSLSDFSLQDFGIRLTSVGTVDGDRNGSLKLGGEAPEMEGGGGGPEGPSPSDDFMFAVETETFNPPMFTDQLADGTLSLLANDPGATAVSTVNGAPAGDIVQGSDGGYLIVYPDGTFDFSTQDFTTGVNDFEYLNDNETATTTFAYTTDNDLEATLTVTVSGSGGGDGGPVG